MCPTYLNIFSLFFMGMLFGGTPSILHANPTDGTVVAGSATITQAPGLTTINQGSNTAIINWNSFSISHHETTQFNQPSSSSIALNRVLGNDPSIINGNLRANGQVWIMNQSGILFGPNARVDVAGLVATTANISNSDFMAGRYNFTQAAGRNTAVINQGYIRVKDQGIAALVAPGVENSGVIVAKFGKVALASGTKFTVDMAGDQLIHFAVDGPAVTGKVMTPEGRELNDAVRNSGKIIANGGNVLLTSQAAKQVVNNVINMDGVIQARSIAQRGGTIILSSGGSGVVKVSGKLIASGRGHNQKGGVVKVLGEKIILAQGTRIDVSGLMGGGEILIGGNAHGLGLEPRAKFTTVDADVVLTADALKKGDGGKVVIWSDDTTNFAGQIFARGGPEGGNGGFVETSGARLVIANTAKVVASAIAGVAGTWLLDPDNLTIVAGGGTVNVTGSTPFTTTGINAQLGVDLITAALNLGTNVIVQTTNSGNPQPGNITVSAPIVWGAASKLTLQALNDISINAAITGPLGTLVLQALGSVTQTAPVVVNQLRLIVDTNVTLTNAANQISNLAGFVAGNLNIFTTGNLSFSPVDGATSLATGALLAQATANIIVNEVISATAGTPNELVLVTGGSFINTAGSASLNPIGGRFLIYSNNSANDVLGGLSVISTTGTFTANPPASLANQVNNLILYPATTTSSNFIFPTGILDNTIVNALNMTNPNNIPLTAGMTKVLISNLVAIANDITATGTSFTNVTVGGEPAGTHYKIPTMPTLVVNMGSIDLTMPGGQLEIPVGQQTGIAAAVDMPLKISAENSVFVGLSTQPIAAAVLETIGAAAIVDLPTASPVALPETVGETSVNSVGAGPVNTTTQTSTVKTGTTTTTTTQTGTSAKVGTTTTQTGSTTKIGTSTQTSTKVTGVTTKETRTEHKSRSNEIKQRNILNSINNDRR